MTTEQKIWLHDALAVMNRPVINGWRIGIMGRRLS